MRPIFKDGVFAYQEADDELSDDKDGEAIHKALDEPDHAIDQSSNKDSLKRKRLLMVMTVVMSVVAGGLGTVMAPKPPSSPP